MPCKLCYAINQYDDKPEDFELQEATRVLSWSNPGSPMLPVCDHHAFVVAKTKLAGLNNLLIDTIDDAMDTEKVFYD
jgi:hypothetical protein